MVKDKLNTALFAVFYTLFSFPLVYNYDWGDFRKNAITIIGSLILVVAAIRNKISSIHIIFAIAPILAILGLFFNRVQGHSVIWVAFLVGCYGWWVWVTTIDIKSVLATVALVGLLQILVSVTHIIPWTTYVNKYMSNWGSVRHAIRFCTLMYAGYVASMYLASKTKTRMKFFWWLSALIQFVFVFVAGSDTLIAISMLLVFVTAMVYIKKKALLVFFALLLITIVSFSHDGFKLDDGRKGYWKSCAKACIESPRSIMIGHGVRSWPLNAKVYSKNNVHHPHNEALNLFYEYGIVGFFLLVGLFLILLVMSMMNACICIGFLGITASFLTNSMRYPDMMMIWLIFAAISFRNGLKWNENFQL